MKAKPFYEHKARGLAQPKWATRPLAQVPPAATRRSARGVTSRRRRGDVRRAR